MTVHYSNQKIVGKHIVIKGPQAFVLGPELILENCHLQMNINRQSLTIVKTEIIDCIIEAKKPLENLNWCAANIQKSRFLGQFSGCDFGYWAANGSETGGLINCNFSGCVLDGCRFFGIDEKTIEFPNWPCFVVSNPRSCGEKLLKLELVDNLKYWAEGLTWSPAEAEISVEWAPRIIEDFGSSEHYLRELVRSHCGS